jgi:hypothetical protein
MWHQALGKGGNGRRIVVIEESTMACSMPMRRGFRRCGFRAGAIALGTNVVVAAAPIAAPIRNARRDSSCFFMRVASLRHRLLRLGLMFINCLFVGITALIIPRMLCPKKAFEASQVEL